jgi:hypothetical protein
MKDLPCLGVRLGGAVPWAEVRPVALPSRGGDPLTPDPSPSGAGR